jgi:hypothetical protein
LDGDCRVDFADLKILADRWLDTSCSAPDCEADLDGVPGVNMVDFALLAESWLEDYSKKTLVINEFMAKNDGSIRDPQGDYDDWIEIYNYGDDTVDIGGMYLTDDLSAPAGWQVPRNNPAVTTIPARGYLLIWADDETNEGTLHAGFKLSADGEDIGLFDADGSTLIDSVTFGPQVENRSYGRLPDASENWQVFSNPTPGASNAGGPVQVLINEIMYHPFHPTPGAEDIGAEYIELFNFGAGPASLSGWRFSNGVDFAFPDVTFGAGEYLVVAADVNTFTAKYPGVPNVIGGWDGRLSNRGEAIELVDGAGVRIDRVRYADEGDWAVRELGPVDRNHRGWIWSDEHDGGGKSLELINPALPNEYGQNWAASDSDEGTPGVSNSVAAEDIAPLILDVTHFPIIPWSNDAVTVTAQILDEPPTALTVTLHYRVDASVYERADIFPHHEPNDYTDVTMFDDGSNGDGEAGDGVYGAVLPAQQDGTIVEFYLEATDAGGNRRTCPAPSIVDTTSEQVTNALYQVNDSFDGDVYWEPGRQPIYYLIMTAEQWGRLQAIWDASNLYGPDSQMNATFVSADGVDVKLRYNTGVRNRGHGSRRSAPHNFRVNIPHHRSWKGVTAININSRRVHVQLAGNSIFRLSGLTEPETTAVQLRVNGENLADMGGGMYGSYVQVEVVDGDFADNHYPDDGDGNAYKCMRDAGPADMSYRGPDPNSYRNSYFKQTNTGQDDWSDLVDLCYVMSWTTSDDIYVDEVRRVANVERWIRFFALNALLDNSETSLSNGYGDDYYLYRGIEDPRFVLIQHDLDSVFGYGGSQYDRGIFRALGLETIDRFLTHPEFAPRYYFHLRELIETTFSAEQMEPFLDNLLGDFVPAGAIDQMKDFVAARNSHVLSLIPSELTVETDLPQSNGYYLTNVNTFSLYGTADAIETRSVLVNGQSADWSPIDGMWDFGGAGGIAETLVSDHSVWKYLDDGSDQGVPSVSTEWFGHPDYSDSLWLEGPAELGYGDASQGRPEVTVVNSGPNGNHFITTYFRHSFNVNDASQYSGLRLRLLYDDGAVVYLNGIEAARRNMPGGDINFVTRANNNRSGTAEYTFSDLPLDPELLSTGINVLAVEIHQSSSTSADISFDLQLDGIMPPQGAGALQPGINRVTVETFDGPNGMGNKKSGSIDIWYDAGGVAEISGTLGSDTTLDAASGPWYVMGNVIVPAGATLTIEPGTTLFFDTGTGIIIEQGGRLVAAGNEHERIRLTRLPGSGSRWDGIQFDQTMEDNNLSYVDMEYGDGLAQAISIDRAQLLIDNMTWTRTDKNVLEVSHPHLIIRNCVFPDHDDEEAIHGDGLTGSEYLIIQGNTFGRSTGYQDVIDFSDCHLPGPIIQIYDNVFLGGEDDGLDLDDADACIEGNVFVNFLGGSGTGTANAIAADQGSQITVARNIFYDNVNAVLLKGNAEMRAENNTFVGHAGSVVSFYESGSTSGKGAYMDGNIFWNNADLFQNVGGQVELAVHRSILPTASHHFGDGNIDADPLFVDPNIDFHLRSDSAAIGSGPCGLDMGAYVPSGAAICGEPDQITYRTDATLAVGGPGITHYMYRLNSGPWSDELPVDVPIELSNLLNGQAYTVYVTGRNSAGFWQSADNPTVSRTWIVDTSYSKLIINEVLAHTHGADPDLIELYYDGPGSLDLSEMSLTDDSGDTKKFVFGSATVSNTIMNPGDYMLLYGDLDTQSKDHLGFALSSEGEGLYLYDKPANGGGLIDSVEFGPQINGLSIGRIGYGGTWKLNKPTLGQENVAQPLGDPDTLKINEWLANGEVLFENDFIELYNPDTFPVDLSSLYLTDNPVTQPGKCQLGPLSFIAGQGFAVFIADDQSQPGHVDFRLSADGEIIGLFDAELNEIDKVLYGPQTTDVSQGRVPDGTDSFEFFELPTPAIANPSGGPPIAAVTTLVPEDADKRVLIPTGDIGQAWRTEPDFNDSSWALCTGSPGGVGYERTMGFEDFISLDVREQMYFVNATCYIRIPFAVEANELAKLAELTLKVRYDDGFIAYLNGAELANPNFSGTPVWNSRASSTRSDSAAVVFEYIDISGFISDLEPGDNILAIQGMNSSSTSPDFLLSVELDAVITKSAEEFSFANALELLDGLRVTELMYHAADGSNFDYIELQNISETTLDLYGVRFSEGIDFTFPDMTLEAGRHVVVAGNLAGFRSAYGTNINVAGEYSGNLSNGGEDIILNLPLPLQAAILRFEYSDTWYPTTDGGGDSLVISDPAAHPATWGEPESWHPAIPTPGRP